MNTLCKGAIIILVSIVLTSCTSAKIDSNAATKHAYKMEKVFVLVYTQKENEEYSNEFYNALKAAFSDRNIESETYIRNPLSLDTEESINTKINTYNPGHVMTIDHTRMLIGGANIVISSNFQISILEHPTNEPAWKGIMKVWGDFGIRASIKKSIKKLMLDLDTSNLLN